MAKYYTSPSSSSSLNNAKLQSNCDRCVCLLRVYYGSLLDLICYCASGRDVTHCGANGFVKQKKISTKNCFFLLLWFICGFVAKCLAASEVDFITLLGLIRQIKIWLILTMCVIVVWE